MMDDNVNVVLAYRHVHRWVCADCGDEQVVRSSNAPRSLSWPPTVRRGRPHNPVVRAQREAWQAAYLADPNTTIKSVAGRFGVNPATVYSGLRALKTPMHRKRGQSHIPDPGRIEAVRAMLIDERLTLEQAGQRLGITRERVRQIAARHGIGSTKPIRHAQSEERLANLTKTCWLCGKTYSATPGDAKFREHWKAAGHTKITPEDDAKYLAMVADYDAGMKNKDIRIKYACSPTLIYRALRYVGRTHDRKNTSRSTTLTETYARKDAIEADLRSKTWTVPEIAERHGCSTTWVYLVGRERDCSPTRGETNALNRVRR